MLPLQVATLLTLLSCLASNPLLGGGERQTNQGGRRQGGDLVTHRPALMRTAPASRERPNAVLGISESPQLREEIRHEVHVSLASHLCVSLLTFKLQSGQTRRTERFQSPEEQRYHADTE